MFGYQAQTETAGADLLTILLVQFVSFGLAALLFPPPLHAAIGTTMARAAIAAKTAFCFFTVFSLPDRFVTVVLSVACEFQPEALEGLVPDFLGEAARHGFGVNDEQLQATI
jgi:hypothetical protein